MATFINQPSRFTVQQIEEQVYRAEGVRVVIRLPAGAEFVTEEYSVYYTNRIHTNTGGNLINRVRKMLTHPVNPAYDDTDAIQICVISYRGEYVSEVRAKHREVRAIRFTGYETNQGELNFKPASVPAITFKPDNVKNVVKLPSLNFGS